MNNAIPLILLLCLTGGFDRRFPGSFCGYPGNGPGGFNCGCGPWFGSFGCGQYPVGWGRSCCGPYPPSCYFRPHCDNWWNNWC